jgi:methyltransferase (TIGR00027 family)
MFDSCIENNASLTAAMTCTSRAASSLERSKWYRSNDDLSVKLLPYTVNAMLHIPMFRYFFTRLFSPPGIYEYVIARTKYIDEVYEKVLDQQFHQILLLGAGYDTRAYRFNEKAHHTRIFELDAPSTQASKIDQLKKRDIRIPPNVVFVPVDFNRDSLSDELDTAGFKKNGKSLFILEGLIMYLDPESVHDTFRIIREKAGVGSRIVFDYVRSSVFRHENSLYGEAGVMKAVANSREQWRFGLEPGEAGSFLAEYGFEMMDQKCAEDLEAAYFQNDEGLVVGRVNGTHCIVTAEAG